MVTYTKVHHEEDHDHDCHGADQQQEETTKIATAHVEQARPDHLRYELRPESTLTMTAAATSSSSSFDSSDAAAATSTTTMQAVSSSCQPRITWFDACMHLIKGNLGPGCLNLPYAFAESGWLLGTLLFLVVAIQGIYSMILLAECKDRLFHAGAASHPPVLTFMDVAQVSLGPMGRAIVQVFLFVLQSGVCCVFLSLIATNLRAQTSLSSMESIVLVTIALLLVSMVRHMKNLRCLSTTANLFMLTAILTATVAAGYSIVHDDIPLPAKSTTDIGTVATFISSLFFSFEGIGLVLPVENAYTTSPFPDQVGLANQFFRHYLLPGAMAVVGMLFWMTGFLASWGFPHIHSGSITAYLAQEFPHHAWFRLVNTLVMMAVLLTFPLQLTPAVQVLEDLIMPPSPSLSSLHPTQDDTDILPTTRSSSSSSMEMNDSHHSHDYDNDDHDGYDGSVSGGVASLPMESLPPPPSHNKTFWQRHHWIILRCSIVLGCALVVLLVDDLALLMALFGAIGQTGLAMMPCWCHRALQRQGLAPQNWGKTLMDLFTIVFSTAVMMFGVYSAISRMILHR